MIRIMMILLAMLFGFWDLLTAAPPDARLKTIFSNESNGPHYISGVSVMATLVTPLDSTGVPYSTHSGVIYSTTTPVDSAQSDANGKWAIRLPLTSDISPGGCQWQLTASYRGSIRWQAKVSLSDTTTTCLQKATGQTSTCANE